MAKKSPTALSFCRIAFLIPAGFFAAIPFLAAQASPQPEPAKPDLSVRRFELGFGFANIQAGCKGQSGCQFPTAGLGLGTSINLNSHFAIDSQIEITATSSNAADNAEGGRIAEYLSGVRAETRSRRYGYFLKAQPGLFTWSHTITGLANSSPPSGDFNFNYGYRKYFVSNVGGGFEYSPTPRVHIRAEVTDLLMDFGGSWNNNLQSMVGVYAGLGKPLTWSPPRYDPAQAHRFFDPLNDALISGSVLGMTADSITTQRFIAHGSTEGDPFARPLAKYGWSGQVTLEGLEASGEVLAMYGLHRIHQHWIERLLPVSAAIAHGVLAYQNTKVTFHPSTP